jgi:phenylacetate-CoA ligase
VELKPWYEAQWPDLKVRLAKDLAGAHEGLRFNIERMDYGVLPHFELKAKRLVDARPVAQY